MMNITIFLPFFALIFGVFGGILRGLSLINGYEPQTLLPIADDKFQLFLIILSIISVILFFALSFKNKNRSDLDFETAFGSNAALFKTISVLSAMLISLCGAAGLYFTITAQDKNLYSHITDFPLWVLAVFSGLAIIGLTNAVIKKEISETNAYLALVPMFWAAFDLIVIFKNNSSSPLVSYYSFDLIPSIFLTLAFYAFAGFLYSKPKPAFMIFASSLAIVFSLTCVIGTAMAQIAAPAIWSFDMQTIVRLGCLTGGALYLFGLTSNLCKNV